MLARLLRWLSRSPEVYELTGVTALSLRDVLETPAPQALTRTAEALYPQVERAPCVRCRTLRAPEELRQKRPRVGWCGRCVAEAKAEQREKRERKRAMREEEMRCAEAQGLVVAMERRRG